jgi:hypothetical protein
MLLLLALLLVLIFFGAGFALHLLWIVAVALLVLWIVGFVIGRGRELDATSSTAGKIGVVRTASSHVSLRGPLVSRRA